jgi:heam-based aerotactic trancducer
MSEKTLSQQAGIDAADRQLRLNWLRLDETDLALVRESAVHLLPIAEELVKEFYDHSFAFPEFRAKVEIAGSNRGTLEGAQLGYFKQILDGNIDDAYVEYRLHIGKVHATLNIEPRWNVANYAMYMELIRKNLTKKIKGDKLADTLIAFNKLITFDISLVTEAYILGFLEKLMQTNSVLNETSTNLDTSASQVDTAAREIANAVQEIARGAGEQTDAMTGLNGEMTQLNESIGQVSGGAEDQYAAVEEAKASAGEVTEALGGVAGAAKSASETSEQSLSAAKEGMTSVQQTVEAMGTIRAAVTTTAEQVQELGKRGDEIGNIVQTIDEIAAQTNLLALNAAIEAARAGEQGRGFAVVADNVRTLAERSSDATKEIADLVAKVQAGTGEAVRAMEGSVTDVEEGATRAEQAGAALNRIVDSATVVSGEIEQIATSAEQMQSSATQMAEVIDKVGEISERLTGLAESMKEASERSATSIASAMAVSEESASAAQEVSASVEEVTAQIGEVANLTKGLGEASAEMTDFLAQYSSSVA